MDITVHQARKLTAKAEHNGTSHWVDLTIAEFINGRERETEITLFFDGDIGAASADRLAAAINDAKAEGA